MASVSQITKFDAVCRARGQRRRREGKYSISKCSFLLTSVQTVCLNLGFLNMSYLVCLSLHCVTNLLRALGHGRGHLLP